MLTEILKQYEKQGQESSQPRADKVRFDVVLYYFIELHLPSTPNTPHSLDLSKDTRGGVLSKTLRTNRPGRQLVAGKDGRALLSASTLLHHEKVRTQLWRPSTFHSTQKDVVVHSAAYEARGSCLLLLKRSRSRVSIATSTFDIPCTAPIVSQHSISYIDPNPFFQRN